MFEISYTSHAWSGTDARPSLASTVRRARTALDPTTKGGMMTSSAQHRYGARTLRVAQAAFLVAAGLAASARGELPAHARRIAGADPIEVRNAEGGTGGGPRVDAYVEFWPDLRDDRFDNGVGLGLSALWAFDAAVAMRGGAAFAQWDADSDDADILPIGLSALIGPQQGAFSGALEIGLRYIVVDFEDDGGGLRQRHCRGAGGSNAAPNLTAAWISSWRPGTRPTSRRARTMRATTCRWTAPTSGSGSADAFEPRRLTMTGGHSGGWRKWAAVAAFLAAGAWGAEGTVTLQENLDPGQSGDLQSFKAKVQTQYPDMDVVSVRGSVEAVVAPRVQPVAALFVRNQTRREGLDDEVDGIRDYLAAELAGAEPRHPG
jgi:hypothetical protein